MRPPSFVVLGQRFRVKTYAHITDGEDTSLRGDVSHEDGVVRLVRTMAEEVVAETYLHEMLHVIMCKIGFGSTMTYDEQEALVNRMSPVLYDTLKRNPRVYTFLTGRETYR